MNLKKAWDLLQWRKYASNHRQLPPPMGVAADIGKNLFTDDQIATRVNDLVATFYAS